MTIHSDIDKIFNKGLADFSEKAPSFIWDNIEIELNKKRNKTKRLAFYAIAASFALLLSFGAGNMFTNYKNNQHLSKAKSEVNIPDETNEKLTPQKNKIHQPIIGNDVTNNNINLATLTAETKENKKEDDLSSNAKVTKPIVKKANATPPLPTPIYTNQSNFDSQEFNSQNSKNIAINTKNQESLQKLESRLAVMTIPTTEKDLVYEIRELPLFPLEDEYIKPTKKYDTWALGLSGTPLLSYRHVQSSGNDVLYASVNTSGLQQNYDNEKPLISYSAGLNVNYNLSNRWAIQSGFYYSETGQTIENIYLDQTPSAIYNNSNTNYEINTSAGNIVIGNSQAVYASRMARPETADFAYDNTITPDGAILSENKSENTSADFVQTLEYYELPLIVNYKMIDRKLDVKLSGGFSANFLSSNNTYLENNGNRQDINAEVSGIKNINYASIIGIGLEYPLISRLLLNLSPTFRYTLNSINTTGNTHPYSFGVYTGLKYSF